MKLVIHTNVAIVAAANPVGFERFRRFELLASPLMWIEAISSLHAMLWHGAPQHLRADNGPEMIAWALHDYCRLAGTKTAYIEPGAPWKNPYVESFNGRLRDELLNIEEFGSLTEAKIIIEDWRIEYNTYRPHSSLSGLAPTEYAHTITNNKNPDHA